MSGLVDLIEAGVGWPGIYAAYWRGILAPLDVGAKIAFDWSFEGQFTGIRPCLRVQVQGRYLFFESGKLTCSPARGSIVPRPKK